MKHARRLSASYIRNFIFGVEDGLVSTVGLLSGLAFAGQSNAVIVLTGVVLIFVEGFSMAVGSFLSEYAAEEYERRAEVSPRHSIAEGVIMFFSYLVSGFIPLAPYLFTTGMFAMWISVGLSLFALLILGIIGARLAHVSLLRHGLRMVLVGGIAIAIGMLVGRLMPSRF